MTQPQDEEKKGTLESFGYTESFFGHKGRKFYGRYRAKVAANVDPLGQGRLSVIVPDVKSLFPKMWARLPLPVAPVPGSVTHYSQGASITIGPAGITLFVAGTPPTMIQLGPAGITITAPKITIAAPKFTLTSSNFTVV